MLYKLGDSEIFMAVVIQAHWHLFHGKCYLDIPHSRSSLLRFLKWKGHYYLARILSNESKVNDVIES